VRVQLEGRAFEGRAEGIDEAGHLIVHADHGAVEHVVAGDVQLVRSDG
jgi:biotin-(acetyl-CoA carboxylase) ligase